jgi:hypothetical protein
VAWYALGEKTVPNQITIRKARMSSRSRKEQQYLKLEEEWALISTIMDRLESEIAKRTRELKQTSDETNPRDLGYIKFHEEEIQALKERHSTLEILRDLLSFKIEPLISKGDLWHSEIEQGKTRGHLVVKSLVAECEKANKGNSLDDCLYEVAEKLGKSYEAIKGAYHYKGKTQKTPPVSVTRKNT